MIDPREIEESAKPEEKIFFTFPEGPIAEVAPLSLAGEVRFEEIVSGLLEDPDFKLAVSVLSAEILDPRGEKF